MTKGSTWSSVWSRSFSKAWEQEKTSNRVCQHLLSKISHSWEKTRHDGKETQGANGRVGDYHALPLASLQGSKLTKPQDNLERAMNAGGVPSSLDKTRLADVRRSVQPG